jgi:hypothetical protein
MPVFFDHDEVTGVTQTYDYDPVTDSHHITSHQDLTGFLDNMQRLRNDPDHWKRGVKEEWAHYATIPPIVELSLKKKGIDIHNSAHTKRLLNEINHNYPYLKATDRLIK